MQKTSKLWLFQICISKNPPVSTEFETKRTWDSSTYGDASEISVSDDTSFLRSLGSSSRFLSDVSRSCSFSCMGDRGLSCSLPGGVGLGKKRAHLEQRAHKERGHWPASPIEDLKINLLILAQLDWRVNLIFAVLRNPRWWVVCSCSGLLRKEVLLKIFVIEKVSWSSGWLWLKTSCSASWSSWTGLSRSVYVFSFLTARIWVSELGFGLTFIISEDFNKLSRHFSELI